MGQRRLVTRSFTAAMALMLLASASPVGTPTVSAAALPSGFVETVAFTGLVNPTNVQFASTAACSSPRSAGTIKVFDSLTDTTPDTFADLRTNVHDFWDRGLLGLALRSGFPDRTLRVRPLRLRPHPRRRRARAALGRHAARPRPVPPADGCVVSGRLSRLQAAGNVMTGTEQVLIEDWCQQYPSHSIGSLVFGSDGALYVSGGDGASFNFADYGQAAERRQPGPKNPCGDPPGAVGRHADPADRRRRRAAQPGRADDRRPGEPRRDASCASIRRPAPGCPATPSPSSSDANARRIVAYGLRNPFRIADPARARPRSGSATSAGSTWEEINRVVDTGRRTSSRTSVGRATRVPAGRPSYDSLNLEPLRDPLRAAGPVIAPVLHLPPQRLDRVRRGAAPTARARRPSAWPSTSGGDYPPAYDGALFFADYSRDCLWAMLAGLQRPARIPTKRANFLTSARQPGRSQDRARRRPLLRRLQRRHDPSHPVLRRPTSRPTRERQRRPRRAGPRRSGRLRRIGVRATRTATRSPTAWDLDGNGTFGDATTARRDLHVPDARHVHAALRVTDPHGARRPSAPMTISVGNTPPIPVIETPSDGLTWAVGDRDHLHLAARPIRGWHSPGTARCHGRSSSSTARRPAATSTRRRRSGRSGHVHRARSPLPEPPRAAPDGTRLRSG